MMNLTFIAGREQSLRKAPPDSNALLVGLGWDVQRAWSEHYDFGVFAFQLSALGKVRTESDVVFCNNPSSPEGAVSLTGTAPGDRETLILKLDRVPAEVVRIVMAVVIYNARARHQNFGQVSDIYLRLVDAISRVEMARYCHSCRAVTAPALVFGEFYRDEALWGFEPAWVNMEGGLNALAHLYGVRV